MIILDTVQDLRLSASTDNVTVLGYWAPNDGGGGIFVRKPSGTGVVDDGLYFSSTDTDVWERQYRTFINDHISVRWFGARGNGVDDDTCPVRYATASGKVLDNPIPIYFPNGRYLMKKRVLTTYDGGSWIGESHNAVILVAADANLYYRYGRSYPGNPASARGRTGILNVQHHGWTVSNLKFDQNFRNSNFTFLNGGNPATGPMSDVDRTSHADTPGIGKAAGIIFGVFISDPDNPGYLVTLDNDAPPVTNGKVTNCIFYDYFCDCITSHRYPAEDIIVENNIFISSFTVNNWGIGATGGEQAVASYSDHSSDRPCKRWQIKNNRIFGPHDDAIAIHNYSEDIEVIGNYIQTTGGRILINSAKRINVTGNIIYYIQDGGSAIACFREELTNNPTTIADYPPSDYVNISGNIIYIPEGIIISKPIFIKGGGNNITISRNKIRYADPPSRQPFISSGIYLSYFDESSVGAGIKNLQIFENDIFQCTEGIHVAGFKDGSTSSGLTGVLVANVDIYNNTIHSADTGILVETENDPTNADNQAVISIRKNTIYCNTNGTGIDLNEVYRLRNRILNRNNIVVSPGVSNVTKIATTGYMVNDELIKTVRYYLSPTSVDAQFKWENVLPVFTPLHDILLIGGLPCIYDASGNGPSSAVTITIANFSGAGNFMDFSIAANASTATYQEQFDLSRLISGLSMSCLLSVDGGGSLTHAVSGVLDLYYVDLNDL